MNLPCAMEEFNFDIKKFNLYIDWQIITLSAKGQESHNLLVNLFHAYKIVKEKNFRYYIEAKQWIFHERGNIKPEQVMKIALIEYRHSSKAYVWRLPLKENHCIVTFTNTVKCFKKENENLKTSISWGRGPVN